MVQRKLIKNLFSIPHKNCPLNHRFSPQLVHAHSEQWYYISDISELPYIWNPNY